MTSRHTNPAGFAARAYFDAGIASKRCFLTKFAVTIQRPDPRRTSRSVLSIVVVRPAFIGSIFCAMEASFRLASEREWSNFNDESKNAAKNLLAFLTAPVGLTPRLNEKLAVLLCFNR